MKVTFDMQGNFNNTLNWLKKVGTHDISSIVDNIAHQGTIALASATPKDTGETALGWKAVVKTSGGKTEIAWINNAHPEAGVNLAKLIHLGHGTRTGGYVSPRPYINKAIDPILTTAGDKIAKEVFK